MRFYDATFFLDSEEELSAHIDTSPDSVWPITLRINSGKQFSKPSVMFHLNQDQWKAFVNSVIDENARVTKELQPSTAMPNPPTDEELPYDLDPRGEF